MGWLADGPRRPRLRGRGPWAVGPATGSRPARPASNVSHHRTVHLSTESDRVSPRAGRSGRSPTAPRRWRRGRGGSAWGGGLVVAGHVACRRGKGPREGVGELGRVVGKRIGKGNSGMTSGPSFPSSIPCFYGGRSSLPADLASSMATLYRLLISIFCSLSASFACRIRKARLERVRETRSARDLICSLAS